MSLGVEIRVASEADIPEMHRIRMAVRENQLADAALVSPGDYRAMLNERGRGWVAETGGRIVGFAIADLTRCNIWALFVHPDAERCGVGRRLHDVMLAWLFTSGAAEVWLATEPGTRAERFYLAAGWRHRGRDQTGEARYTLSPQEWLARPS